MTSPGDQEAFTLEEPICVKETLNHGLGVFATRDILKNEIILEFRGRR